MLAEGVSPRGLVLVVDDHAEVRRMAQRMLEGSQFRALTAEGADAALRLLDKHGDDIHVLLTELRMPDGDGVALAQRAVDRNPELRVVYMSAIVSSDTEVAAVAASGAPFVQKPFTVDELSGAIATARSS